MKGKDPAFLFYDGDAARDVSHMNRLERGAYFDLIQAQRKFGGYTVEQARKILGRDFDEVWPALELILSVDERGLYYIEWVRDSIENRKEHAEKQRKRIQDYWDKKKKEESESDTKSIPRNNHGNTVDVPLENENENENINKDIDKGVQGDKKKKPDPDELLLSKMRIEDAFKDSFLDWLRYKRKKGQSYKDEESTTLAFEKLKSLAGDNPVTAAKIVNQSRANNWAGLFELKEQKLQGNGRLPQPSLNVNEKWKR